LYLCGIKLKNLFMMKRLTLIALIMLLVASFASAQEVKKVYDETIDPIEQIDQALAKARTEGKFVIAQVGGNWCPWCLRFAAFMEADSAITDIVEKNFVYIHVNYHPRKNKGDMRAQQMLKRLGNCGRFGYPVMVVLDPDGNVVHIQDSAYLEEGKTYSHDKVMSFFSHWTPAAVRGQNP